MCLASRGEMDGAALRGTFQPFQFLGIRNKVLPGFFFSTGANTFLPVNSCHAEHLFQRLSRVSQLDISSCVFTVLADSVANGSR